MEENTGRNWRDTRFNAPSQGNLDEITNGKRLTALQRLAQRYKRFTWVALIMFVYCFVFFSSHDFPASMRGWLMGLFGIYFVIVYAMDSWLYAGISRIDCATMPVGEVSRLALYYRKRHLQFIIILIPMAVALIGLLACSLATNVYFIAGIVCGIIGGLAIAIHQFRNFMADYRDASAQ